MCGAHQSPTFSAQISPRARFPRLALALNYSIVKERLRSIVKMAGSASIWMIFEVLKKLLFAG